VHLVGTQVQCIRKVTCT